MHACIYVCMSMVPFASQLLKASCVSVCLRRIYIYGQTHYFEIFCQVERNLEREAICEEAIKWRWESVS